MHWHARHGLSSNAAAGCCRRDEALAAIQDSIWAQQQQELAIDTEIQGYKKDINKEQVGVPGSTSRRGLKRWQTKLCNCQKVDRAANRGLLAAA
jgi:hypothetical protein